MADLARLALRLLSSTVKVEPTSKRIRTLFGGIFVFDSTKAKYVWEIPNYPQLYVPIDAVSPEARLEIIEAVDGSEERAFHTRITTANKTSDRLLAFGPNAGSLSNLVKIDWHAMDQWFEELYPMIIHPRNPYTRVDILPTERRIRVDIDGVTIAESNTGNLSLWETALPVRWYLPKTSLKWHYVTESQTQTGCPYKGWARYYNVVVNGDEYNDIIWWYPGPLVESAAIHDMVCFYNSRVDLFIDGKKEGVD